jgi:lipopolysaccharide transport system ATP-binding protein
MGEVAQRGRTVLFVSHNLATVVELCQRGILLEAGRVKNDGPSSESVNLYAKASYDLSDATSSLEGRFGFEGLRINGSVAPTVGISDPLSVSVKLRGVGDDNPLIYVILEDSSGKSIICERKSLGEISRPGGRDDHRLYISVPSLFLSPGFYSMYFKALSTTVGQPSRILSERIPLVVRGETDSLGRSLLCPDVKWSAVEPANLSANGC